MPRKPSHQGRFRRKSFVQPRPKSNTAYGAGLILSTFSEMLLQR